VGGCNERLLCQGEGEEGELQEQVEECGLVHFGCFRGDLSEVDILLMVIEKEGWKNRRRGSYAAVS
jgi:hypothetical protein